ncbi:Tyrosine-protein phosphatase non-receptor type 9 [Nymphon striatum]|nr:Tyrosine-protein phosphatase non-receptor type 9 [Nymphon striatum]
MGGYPARLKKVLIVTAPLWFKAPFKILRLFVREKLRDRVFTLSIPQLQLHIPANSLPRELGGNLQVDHKGWLLYCLKSMTNRYTEVCAASPAGEGDATQTFIHKTSSEETDESQQNSIHEKHNSEDREKEVEVTKDNSFEALKVETVEEIENKRLSAVDSIPCDVGSRGSSLNVSPNTSPLKRLSVSSVSSTIEESLHSDDGTGIQLDEFITMLRSKRRKGLYEEYFEIKSKSPDGTFESSRLKPNMSKNRYTDVLCFDHSRVKLTPIDADPCTDYVNANFVDGYKQKNAFISTQGPIGSTFGDFWRMVWEQHVLVIVMTTRIVEKGRSKCGLYWPTSKDAVQEHNNFIICCKSVEQQNDYTYVKLTITDVITGEMREVDHLQFTSWPDYGVPHSAVAMLNFLFKVREHQSQAVQNLDCKWLGHPLGPPIIVHCSAGIGRTGTFCTLDISIRKLEDTGLIDVKLTVEKIRSQRSFSIQAPEQYVFCHLALLEYALTKEMVDDVNLDGFNDSDSDSE